MKNKLTTLVPAVALLALSSCASTSGITSTESDGVYYSSKDRTTQAATASVATDEQYSTQAQGIDEDINPEYSSNSKNGSVDGSNTEYYDDSYASRLGRFNNSNYSGLSYYSPVYTDPYFMGGSAFSPYYGLGYGYNSFYDPFYSPYYSPFSYGGLGGSYLSIGLGFGNSWGYRPYGLGYGGFYDGFYNPYYGGLYGGYYGRGSYAYGNPYYYGYSGGDNNRRAVRYAPRVDRSREAISASRPVNAGRGGRYVSQGDAVAAPSGIVAPGSNGTSVIGSAAPNVAPARARGRIMEPGNAQSQQASGLASPNNYNVNERVMSDSEQGAREGRMNRRMVDPSTQSTEQPRLDYSGRNRRSQVVDNSSPASPQDYQQPQRRSRLNEAFRNNAVNNQSTPQRTYESRTYESRTYSEPARMSSPAPSYGGSNGGGGSFGGGGGGGGGRGRIR